MSITSEVSRCIERMPDDVIIMADDLKHTGFRISTIYNSLSDLLEQGRLKRVTKGTYIKSGRTPPSIDEIVDRKARRFGRKVQRKESPSNSHAEIQYEFWTNGRRTSFRLERDRQQYATVVLDERSRASAEKKRTKKSESLSKQCPADGGTSERSKKRHPAKPTEQDCTSWRHKFYQLISEVVNLFENCFNCLSPQNALPDQLPFSRVRKSARELPVCGWHSALPPSQNWQRKRLVE